MAFLTLFFGILILANFGFSAEFDNKIAGTPIVECEREFIRVVVPTLKPFKGRVYVKGESSNDECVWNYANGIPKTRFGSRSQNSEHFKKSTIKETFHDSRTSQTRNSRPESWRRPSEDSSQRGNLYVRKKNGFERVSAPTPTENPWNSNKESSAMFGSTKTFSESKNSRIFDRNGSKKDGSCPLTCPPCPRCEDRTFDDDDLGLLILKRNRRSTPEAGIEVEIGTCNAQRDRIPDPPGIVISFTVVVSFHPDFVTKVDKAYQISCAYEEADRSVSAELDVSPPPENDLNGNIPPPECRYDIFGSSGKPVTNLMVGDVVKHVWSCSSRTSVDLNQIYGLFVYNCFAEDGKNQKIQVIDEFGCSVYPDIIGTPEYSATELRATVESAGIKFPDRDSVGFQCAIRTCLRANGHCDKSVPRCGKNRPRRHSEPSQQPNDWNLHSQRLTVIDIDQNITSNEMQTILADPVFEMAKTEKIGQFCVSVAGFGIIVSFLTFLFTVCLSAFIGLICLKNFSSSSLYP